jgi:AcrR family transcriptional regulator
MAKRTYRLGKRADAVVETRKRIVAAARDLFVETDFHRVSVDEVAARAGVGRTTIFEQFESKSGLLKAVEQEVSDNAGVEELLVALSASEALEALRAAFERGAEVWERELHMFRTLYGLAVVDPEMKQVMAEKEGLRTQLCEQLARRLHAQGSLRVGCSARRARDVLMLLTSFESYETLRKLRGSSASVARLLLEMAEQVLLTSPA